MMLTVNHIKLEDTKDGWVLRYPNGNLVALDKDSGGYPYAAHSIQEVQVWTDWRDVNRFQMMFSSSHLEIVKVKLGFTNIIRNCTEDSEVRPEDPFKRGHRR